jgi:hypothetical protein
VQTMMPPAFATNRRAVGFASLLLLTLTTPLLLFWVGLPPRSELYKGISHLAGPFVFLRYQIFENPDDVDILFLGNSLLRVAIDEPYVHEQLGESLGREAKTLVCGFSWQGYDLQYYVLRDFLTRRKVKMLVLAMPTPQQNSDRPHVQLYRVVRYGDDPAALKGLSLRAKAAVYADFVIGGPRQLLNLFRPNLIRNETITVRSLDTPESREKGYNGEPFTRQIQRPPTVPVDTMIYSAQSNDFFHFDGQPVNAYQLHFIKLIGGLAMEHAVPVVLLHVPLASERGQTVVRERMDWTKILGHGVRIVGVPSGALFRGVPDSEFYRFYEDEHLNRNGQELFTHVITPALVELYAKVSCSKN